MRKPKIRLENHESVYDYFKTQQQNKAAAWLLHSLCARLYRPRVVFAPGAEKDIKEVFDNHRSVVLASNHLRNVDSLILASVCLRQSVLNPMIGNTVIPAKSELFRVPIIGKAAETLGAVPVFRRKKSDGSSAINAKNNSAQRALIATVCARMDAGMHLAIFPEGKGNHEHPATMNKLRDGIGEMVCGVTDIVQPVIIPMAIQYGQFRRVGFRSRVYIGNTLAESFSSPAQLMSVLPGKMQECVDTLNAQTAAQGI